MLVDSVDSDLSDATSILMTNSGSVRSVEYDFVGTWFSFGAAATPEVNITLSTGSIAEASGSVVVTATLSGGVALATGRVTLEFTGAIVSGDYTTSSSTIIIPVGSTTGEMTITSVSDTIDELDELLEVRISDVTNLLTGDTITGSVTIIDDDEIYAELSVTTTGIVESG